MINTTATTATGTMIAAAAISMNSVGKDELVLVCCVGATVGVDIGVEVGGGVDGGVCVGLEVGLEVG